MPEITEKIQRLKKEHKAVILAHNYQLPETQDIADYRGDSLELSRIASQTDANIVVFCGVHFMAETASILCPDKKIIMPEINAGCPMANMITAEDLRELKGRHPKAIVVGYVNTSAEVKAELDFCCTSTNAVQIINHLRDREEIIFVPDKYLADFVSKSTGKVLIAWDGYCPTHVKIMPEDIIHSIRLYPEAKVIVHPECRPEVIALADAAVSTGKMCKYVKDVDAKEFIIGTETGMLHRLSSDNPQKRFFPASEHATCPNMKRTTLEKVLWSLEELKEEVKVPEEIRKKAKKAIDKMLAIT